MVGRDVAKNRRETMSTENTKAYMRCMCTDPAFKL